MAITFLVFWVGKICFWLFDLQHQQEMPVEAGKSHPGGQNEEEDFAENVYV